MSPWWRSIRTTPSHVLPPPRCAMSPIKEIGGTLDVTPDQLPCWVRAVNGGATSPSLKESKR
jgi:hypothetical protein